MAMGGCYCFVAIISVMSSVVFILLFFPVPILPSLHVPWTPDVDFLFSYSLIPYLILILIP